MNTKNIASILIFLLGLSGCGMRYKINREEILKTSTEADFGPRLTPHLIGVLCVIEMV